MSLDPVHQVATIAGTSDYGVVHVGPRNLPEVLEQIEDVVERSASPVVSHSCIQISITVLIVLHDQIRLRALRTRCKVETKSSAATDIRQYDNVALLRPNGSIPL